MKMGAILNVLLAEDRPADVKLILHALRRDGFDVVAHCVETEADFLAHLRPELDIILSDYSMQQFDAERALALVKRSGLDVPFIVVTGTISETVAVEMMKQGATDYLLKDRLSRLGEAVRRASHQRELRRAHSEANTALRESREHLAAIISSAMDAIITVDEDYRITLFNEAAEKLFRCSAAQVMDMHLDAFIPGRFPTSNRLHRQGFGEAGATSGTMNALGLVYGRRADGEEFPAEASISQTRTGGQQLLTVILRDVSERQRTEEALRQSEERYRTLFESNPQPMWVYDTNTLAFLAVNEAAVRHYGYSPEEFLAMTLADIRPKEDMGRLQESLNDLNADVSGPTVWRHLKKDGSVIDVEIIGHGIIFDGYIARLALATDITERKFLEEQLRQAQKMEAVGRLAGGVAHDFNNLLTAIIGYSQLLMARIGSDGSLRRELEEIYKAGTRAASLTSQLLAFSRKQVIQPVSLNLNVIVADMGKMLRRLIGEDIELQFVLADDLGYIKADAGQMQQVVMNLVVNARDAMPAGGRLTIATANVELDEAFTRKRPVVAPGAYVLLRVSDTGCGMNNEIQSRIFEPFFTTKEMGKGTGLGLSTIHGIITQSGGHVWFDSEPEHGTTFEIYLPRIDEREEQDKIGNSANELLHGTETILLVEDEEAVRRLACSILKANGYTVLEARHCEDALTIATAHQGSISLLVTDVVMPQMSGRELAEQLIELRPEIKVLYISGYTDDAIVRTGVLNSGFAFLQKPFNPEAFARKVREALASEGKRQEAKGKRQK
jgi:two-component system, cell cycle sensor histidine kinase and response regulator CckA